MSFTPWWKAMKRVRTSSCCGARQVEFDRRIGALEGLVVFGGALQEALVARAPGSPGAAAPARRSRRHRRRRAWRRRRAVRAAAASLDLPRGLRAPCRRRSRARPAPRRARPRPRRGCARRAAPGRAAARRAPRRWRRPAARRRSRRCAPAGGSLASSACPGHVDGADDAAQHQDGDQTRGGELEPDRQIEEGAHGHPRGQRPRASCARRP